MTGPYDDMLYLPHPTSERHPRMPITNRAAIFSPFAAVSGHAEAIVEAGRLTDQKVELAEDQRLQLDRELQILMDHLTEQPEVSVTWFRPDQRKSGGSYVTTPGKLKKIDDIERVLVMTNGMKIPLNDILEIEASAIEPYFLE